MPSAYTCQDCRVEDGKLISCPLHSPKIAYATRDGDGWALFAEMPTWKTDNVGGSWECGFWEAESGAVYSDPEGFTDVAEILTLWGIKLEEGECKRLEIQSYPVSKTASFSDKTLEEHIVGTNADNEKDMLLNSERWKKLEPHLQIWADDVSDKSPRTGLLFGWDATTLVPKICSSVADFVDALPNTAGNTENPVSGENKAE